MTNLPPVGITNGSRLATAEPRWSFEPLAPDESLFAFDVSWIWAFPEQGPAAPDGIPEGDGTIRFRSSSSFAHSGGVSAVPSHCAAPFPFDTWEIEPPVVTAVDPQEASRGGGTFTIIGENLYPMIIDDVLLGGNALAPANFQAGFDDDGNGEIDVTVPGNVAVGSARVQVTTTFGDASNNDVEVRIRP